MARTAVRVVPLIAALCAPVGALASDDSRLDAQVSAALWPSAGAAAERHAATLDYRVWVGGARASFGLGLAAPAWPRAGLPDGPRLQADRSSMVVGLRYHLGSNSRLVLDSTSLAGSDRDLRMGLELRPARSAALGIARGSLLRVQWTQRSQLSLRLRGGGLTVAYRSQFY